MADYCKYKLNKSRENDLVNRLLSERFDSILLIDVHSGILIETDKVLTGKLLGLVSFEKDLYEKQTEAIINKYLSDIDRQMLLDGMRLANIKEHLKKSNKYYIDFQSINHTYKRIIFEYLDSDVIVLILEDISDILSNDIDPLTGLYNSTGFHKRVKEWLAKNPGKWYRVQRYDLDRFKDINGLYGYSVGNKLLQDIGYYMKKGDKTGSFSAHLNADHFVRFCTDDTISVQEYYDIFNSCFEEYDLRIPITMHIGVYDLCEPDCDSYTMSYKALLALQSEKGSLRKHITFYEKGMMKVEIDNQELLKDINKALENDEFEVWFQPQVDFEAKQLYGAEALVRWRHSQKGLIPPGDFIPLMERSDYIGMVDMYMIEKTCRYMRDWMDEMPELPIIVSVNLSRNDIYDYQLCEFLDKITDKYQIPKKNLRLEITESAYMNNPERFISNVDKLKKSGFVIEMDDFGSGYSSLNTLKDIDIDILKLDMKFLSDSKNIKKSELIISAVINMAKSLELPVIAEGVETELQANLLLSHGCKYMQGYYFSKPVPADEYKKMIDDYRKSIISK